MSSLSDDSLGDDPLTGQRVPKLIWVNSPSNPTGQVLGIEQLAKIVRWARQHEVVVASDECYAELDWRSEVAVTPAGPRLPAPGAVPSILDPLVCDGSHEGLLALYSLSKQSNMAGYRAAFVAGDPVLVARLLEVRKHAGMIVPWPVQQAMVAALADDGHVARQRARYGIRRERLRTALEAAGFGIEHSEAGLYLWAGAAGRDEVGVRRAAARGRETPPGADWSVVSEMADLGILVAPGSFYGEAGAGHVRIALTASDERIDAAAARLSYS